MAEAPFRDREKAREAGRKGGQAKARRTLTLARVEETLGPLETRQDARRRLERLGVWLTAGLLPGSVGHAAVRSVEVWLRDLEADVTFEEIERLRASVAELQAERDRLRREVERLGLELGREVERG